MVPLPVLWPSTVPPSTHCKTERYPMAKPNIAFLGIGLMGLPMAGHLIAAGYGVTAWNRTRAKAEALSGAIVADTPAEAVAGADLVVVMLENGPIVEQVLFGGEGAACHGLRRGALVVDMSSIKPAEAQDHASRLAAQGVDHLDAPVSGGTIGAEQATLAIMCGGTEAAMARAAPLLACLGRAVLVGPSGAGQLAKLANQMIVATNIAAVAEAMAFASAGGADPGKLREALQGGFADSRVLDLHGARMIARDFATKGRTVTHLKDLDNARATAETLGFTAPVLDLTADLFRSLTKHHGDPDHSALILEIERRNAR